MVNPNWIAGTSGNPTGRPPGSRNRRTKDVVEQIISSSNKDPLLTLSEIQATAQDPAVAAMAANMLAPYLHGKVARPQSKYIETEVPLDLPELKSLDTAVDSIARIESALVAGMLSTDDAGQLIAVIEAFIRGKNTLEIAELQERLMALEQAISAQPASAQTMRVEGGLPPLPGTDINMGHELHLNGGQHPALIGSAQALGEPAQEGE